MINKIYSSGIALINSGRIFLIKPFLSKDETWGIPKGHVENNENSINTAVREFIEETGIKILGNINYFTEVNTRFKDTMKIVSVYKCVSEGTESFKNSNLINDGPFKGNPENVDGKWFLYNDAIKCIHRYQIPIIHKLKAEDKSFKNFVLNRKTGIDSDNIVYEKSICIYITDNFKAADIQIISNYSNICDEVVLFALYNEYDYIKEILSKSNIKNIKLVKIEKDVIYTRDIAYYIMKNFTEVNIVFASNKNSNIQRKIHDICKYLNTSKINILDITKHAIEV